MSFRISVAQSVLLLDVLHEASCISAECQCSARGRHDLLSQARGLARSRVILLHQRGELAGRGIDPRRLEVTLATRGNV